MSKEELIKQLLISLNQGNSGYIQDRVEQAIKQYKKLVEKKIISEPVANENCGIHIKVNEIDIKKRTPLKIYCAGFDVFKITAKEVAKKQRMLCQNLGFEALIPIDNECENSQEIFKNNLRMINSCDIIVANLNNFKGKDMDSGTAFEIGYAYSLNKPIFGYINDIRDIITKEKGINSHLATPNFLVGNEICNFENFGFPVNLMIAESCKKIIQGDFTDCILESVYPFTLEHPLDILKQKM